MPNFSFLSCSNILVRGGWVGGITVIIMQVSVQIGLNLTGLELSLAITAILDVFCHVWLPLFRAIFGLKYWLPRSKIFYPTLLLLLAFGHHLEELLKTNRFSPLHSICNLVRNRFAKRGLVQQHINYPVVFLFNQFQEPNLLQLQLN